MTTQPQDTKDLSRYDALLDDIAESVAGRSDRWELGQDVKRALVSIGHGLDDVQFVAVLDYLSSGIRPDARYVTPHDAPS